MSTQEPAVVTEKDAGQPNTESPSEAEPSVIPAADLECLALDYNPTQIQKIVREGILLASAGVAILLQIAHPGVGQGVNEHSNFAYRPVDRLRTTMTYVYCMAFGTPAEKAKVIEMVHRAHASVRGKGYTADDPVLQFWVAATLYACGVDIYEKVFGKLDHVTAEAVFNEYSVLATALRVPPGMWPESRKDFWAYWDEQIDTLEITPHATNVAEDLLRNKNGPLWVRSTLPMLRLLTAQWLPPRMREEFGLKNDKKRQRTYRVLLWATRGTYPHLPLFIREAPLRYYMNDMRNRIKKAEKAHRKVGQEKN